MSKKVDETADAVRTDRAVGDRDVVHGYAETRHRAGSWDKERRAIARFEATRLGRDIRFIVTNIAQGAPQWLYDSLYCARGQAENLIKLHKTQLCSDRTSCRSARANQTRLVLHTAAYWLMLAVRDAIPATRDLAKAEFVTLRLRLIKSPPASSRPPAACASPSPPPVPKSISSARCLRRCSCQAARERRGRQPQSPISFLQRVQKFHTHCRDNRNDNARPLMPAQIQARS